VKQFFNTSIGQVIRDIIEGGIAGAVAAVVALQLDVATPQVILMAVVTGFIAAAIAVARRKLLGTNAPPPGP
jgi:uncharacterized membrane protein YeaQ/YmgE (transglycosylase-associated protein family)